MSSIFGSIAVFNTAEAEPRKSLRHGEGPLYRCLFAMHNAHYLTLGSITRTLFPTTILPLRRIISIKSSQRNTKRLNRSHRPSIHTLARPNPYLASSVKKSGPHLPNCMMIRLSSFSATSWKFLMEGSETRPPKFKQWD
jgi:hypothetical protein